MGDKNQEKGGHDRKDEPQTNGQANGCEETRSGEREERMFDPEKTDTSVRHLNNSDLAAMNGPATNASRPDINSINAPTDIERLKTELEESKKEHLYHLAEFENYKRNVIKERSDLRKYGSERLLVDLLNVFDILETALASEITAENLGSFKKGITLTASELKSVLHRHGVEEVPAQGKAFDPSVHEAISSEETDQIPPGHVSRVFKKPFKLHERVIRPGQVVVAKPKT